MPQAPFIAEAERFPRLSPSHRVLSFLVAGAACVKRADIDRAPVSSLGSRLELRQDYYCNFSLSAATDGGLPHLQPSSARSTGEAQVKNSVVASPTACG